MEPHLNPIEAVAQDPREQHRVVKRQPRSVAAWAHIDAISEWLDRARLYCVDPEPKAAKAAEWLLDNDYQVSRAARRIREDLPPDFYRKLPCLTGGPYDGLPRVLCLAHGLLSAGRLQVSAAAAVHFVRVDQKTVPLTIAELWAFPGMLRLACLELLVTAFTRLAPGLKPPFEVSPCVAMFEAFDDTECASRALRNLGLVTSISWKDFFDQTSRVETILRGDPADVYGRMDFDTRDRYRKAVEELAERSGRPEPEVAEYAVARARAADAAHPSRHVGHWLIGSGRREMEAALGARERKARSWLARHAGRLYAASLAVTGLVVMLVPALYLAINDATPLAWFLGIMLTLLPASVLAVSVVHWLVTLIVPPRVLPKLDFETGIPLDCPTAVVVPVIVATTDEASTLVERLEMHWIANPDPLLRFVLLSDPLDATLERMPGDVAIELALVEGIRRLNQRHGEGGDGPFHLLHRPRRFNPGEGRWMAWERKRGKLEQFNRLILGQETAAFSLHEGNIRALRGLRFVVTVDADTSLPPGTVNRLVGAMAHPLNKADFDPAAGRVRSGYTIIQPRVEIRPESGARSLFAWLCTGDTAIDIYSRATSDVYQDLFGSGTFVGKGIYEVASFDRSLAAKVPENALLSHDLFEGAHGRAALATDIIVYESFPVGYPEYSRRWHRWVRGDWQLLPWLFKRVPGAGGKVFRSTLSALDRLKIADNLRRSLIPGGLVALAAVGWLVLPGSPWIWTLLAIAPVGAALFIDFASDLMRGPKHGLSRGAIWRLAGHAGRWWLSIVFLANDAAVACDAIVRTWWRMFVSRRHLLEWTSAAHVAGHFAADRSRVGVWRQLSLGPAAAVALAVTIALVNPMALLPASPILLLWALSPAIAMWTSRTFQSREEELTADERMYLRRLARRTWLWFETFVGPEDNWLPPDNFQEVPSAEVGHRTSPTNIGMMFLSAITAWDLGYLSSTDVSARIRDAIDTLDRLELHRGHLFNWYDTRLLYPLEPRYVSSVDSGNLAVCLVTLKEFFLEAADVPGLHVALWDGLIDTLDPLIDALAQFPDREVPNLRSRVTVIVEDAATARADPWTWWTILNGLCTRQCPEIETMIGKAIAMIRDPREAGSFHDLRVWLERVHHHLTSMRRDLEALCPWLPLMENVPPTCENLLRGIRDLLSPALALTEIGDAGARARASLAEAARTIVDQPAARWLQELDAAIERGARAQEELRRQFLTAAARADAIAAAMEFGFLYDRESRLFHVGYNVSADRIDPHRYDLFASEARLTSYFAIAMRNVPMEHWFFLGRPLSRLPDGLALISWNGSMFEYLMPSLLLRGGPDTLIARGERAAVDTQRRHAAKSHIPWGVSESAYAAFNADQHYQYHAFGVPGLGLRRGLSRDQVVAPYATALALAVRPGAAVRNLRDIEELGGAGGYGVFESVDFTPDRIPAGAPFSVVRAYMAHHQGMILAAIGNALHDGTLARRFLRDHRMRAMELLLEERIPWDSPPEPVREDERRQPLVHGEVLPVPHSWFPTAESAFPQMHLLGNGRLATWISEAGAGAFWWRKQALTRWSPDATRDNHGIWIYVSDEDSGAVWSVGRQPTGVVSDDSHVVFHAHAAEFHRRDHDIAIGMELGLAVADDVEIRRVTVVNESERPRVVRLTSYGEVVLAPTLDDERHPAFSKLFVGGEPVPQLNGLLFTRRPRSPHEKPPVLLHRIVSDQIGMELAGFDVDRRSFLGRHGDSRRPRGIVGGLAGTTGWTLDPIMALQVRLELAPRERRQVAFVTMVAESRASVLELADRYAEPASLDWVLGDAAAEAARELQRLGIDPGQVPELSTLASLLVHPYEALRAAPSDIAANRLGQPRLWGLSISGDLPILVLRASEQADMGLLPVLIRGQAFWRHRGLNVDLVILRTGVTGYQEPVRERVLAVLRDSGAQEWLGRSGGVHVIFADQIHDDDFRLLETVARVVLDETRGSLAQQLAEAAEQRPNRLRFEPNGARPIEAPVPSLARPTNLLFPNGPGGFTEDGREYVIHLEPGEHTPAPWCNVLANDTFGCIVTEAGGGSTWALNSGENRLTAWTNDPVTDPPSEAIYLRDEETADLWTPTPAPAGADAVCQIRHGAGYTKWSQNSHGLEQELLVFVPPNDPVKVIRLTIRNLRPRGRRVTATCYVEWLLGALPSIARQHVVCEYDPDTQALLARNPWNLDFADRVAFLTSSHPHHGITTDRYDFLGREGRLDKPAGLVAWDLGGRVRAGADPCAALQVHLDIDAGATAEVVFVLGQGKDRAHAEELVRTWREHGRAERGFDAVNHYWDKLLGAVRVRTPDAAFDLMLNRWLLYQIIASRVMARAGFYQAAGALGFRDQLQDVLALLHADPARVRAHIVAVAARQFEEGDVLHWWHPPNDRGVRTRCSDDFLWLPYVTSQYVEATGDASILREEIPFLHAAPLLPDEDDRYTRFEASSERRTLFVHCQRALEHGETRGEHGLPLIGSGDWNDGMNRIGVLGRGESVWLAWFTIATIRGFTDLAAHVDREDLVERWTRRADELRRATEASAWDGHWYLRAFDDDGRKWGSAESDECRIDSISQSWAVLSGTGSFERSRMALQAAARELIREEDRIVRLLWPPFDQTPRDPGYIKAYPPGIRENGGQYTHAAAWLGFAFAGVGDGDQAWRIFNLINPVGHATSRADAEHYRVESYVIAADVAGAAPHTGRGGWTWYTGSAAWTWRLGVEAILGLRLRDGELLIDPCLPKAWGSFEAEIRGPAGVLTIEVEDPEHVGHGLVEMTVDGVSVPGAIATFPTDGSTRRVRVRLRMPTATPEVTEDQMALDGTDSAEAL
jgi:cyclic beta-1,2-glucan synthetase